MAKQAKITFHPSYTAGTISDRLFGAFLEPIGSMVNGVMYNPKHPEADEQGLRKDVIQTLHEAGLPAVRLPGGNFISGWDWKDSIGPKDQRKTHLDLAWFQYIPNDVGIDEYLSWAEKIGFDPMMTINLGTGDINDAIHLVEYVNHPSDTYWSDLRKKNGHEKPYKVKTWYLGNEMDGPWQIGSWEKRPREFGILTHEVSKAMKWVDGSIETVACVSSSPFLDHYPDWDRQVLEECYDTVDYISLHHYHSAHPGDYGAWLAGSAAFEDYIRTEIALCDYIKTKRRSDKTMMLSFDEWGSMTRPQSAEPRFGKNGVMSALDYYTFDPDRTYVHHDPDDWSTRPMRRMGDETTAAIASGSIMMTLLRHADRIRIGCMTGGIGALAAADREHVWKSASYYPFTDMLKYAKGVSLQPQVESLTYDVPGYMIDHMNQYDTRKNIPYVEAAGAYEAEKGELNLFVINRDWQEDAELTLDIKGFEDFELIERTELWTEDPEASNSYEAPDRILPKQKDADYHEGVLTCNLDRLSWNVFRFRRK